MFCTDDKARSFAKPSYFFVTFASTSVTEYPKTNFSSLIFFRSNNSKTTPLFSLMRLYKLLLVIFVCSFFVLPEFLFLLSCRATPEKENSIVTVFIDSSRVKKFSDEALLFCQKKNYNTEFYFLADMKIHSGKNRFIVWSFKQNKILKQGLVTHGCGRAGWSSDDSKVNPVFSNTPDSHCSSLGKYKIQHLLQWTENVNLSSSRRYKMESQY